jgi:hypothetical protein
MRNSGAKRLSYNSQFADMLCYCVLQSLTCHVTVCCRLQELGVSSCQNMTERGLLEGIGSLQGLTLLDIYNCHNVPAEAFSDLFRRPAMSSIMFLDLSECHELDDEGIGAIANRCIKLTYLHI